MTEETTYKHTEVGIIPSDWEVKRLGDLTEKIIGGGTPSRSNKLFWGNEIPWVTVKDFATFNSYQTQEYITKDGLNNSASHLIPSGIIITSTRMALGKAVIYNVDVSINQDLKAIFLNKNIDTKFFYFWFQFNSKYIEDLGSGSTVMGLSLPDLRKIKVPLPPTKAEQTAIATALSDADALINGLEKLITKKRNIKQGAMQKLLQPKEGWEVKKLGEVCEIRKGQLITDSTRINGNVPVIAGGKTPAYYHNKANRNGKTITISGSGASAGYISFHDYPIFASDCSTIEESKDYSIEFIFYLLQLLQEKIYKMQTGGAQPHIHPSDLNPILIPVPTPEEQNKIATILSDMDNEITALETKLEKYRSVKLGMMQNLLTGKIRLV
jgi:type I restriction enzyme S subunit